MPRAAAEAKAHRTQAQRRAATRTQLLDATITCLHDLGYARTTTTEIAERAGVSRGAQLHHFPKKSDLVIAAVEHLFARRHADFVRAMQRLPGGTPRADAAIDLLWSIFSGPAFYTWLELTVAARTDPELKTSVATLTARFVETVERTFSDLFPPPATPTVLHDVAPIFVFALLEGLALGEIVSNDTDRAARVLEALKNLARLVIPAGAG